MTQEEKEQKKEREPLYAVFAEAENHEKPLLQLEITFARLIDDIVVPYHTKDTFFIDGAPLTAEKLRRIKILKLKPTYSYEKNNFNRILAYGDAATKKTFGEQYNTRFEHILRQQSEDVTSQVLKAFNQVIKPKLKNYLPNRQELISAATKVFIEGMKLLGN